MKEFFDLMGGPAMAGTLVLGLLLALGAIFVLAVAQFSPTNKFDAAEMFLDDYGRTSGSKFVSLIAGLASVWVVVFLTVSNKLDATLFVAWLGVVVIGKVATEAVAKWKETPPPPSEQVGDKHGS